MKRIIYLSLFAIALIFAACNKDEGNQPTAEAEFEFKIEQSNFDFKSEVPGCSDLNMDYVKFVVNGETYKSFIYYVNDEYLTQVVKFPVGDYVLTSFLVYNDNGTPDDESDDILIKAAPEPNSDYHAFVENKLDLPFNVDPFYKEQITIDVLCFEELFYDEFGFTWFEFNDIKLEGQAFFGDICSDCYEDYEGSLYANQPNGVQFDMPAIFEIKVFRNDELEPLKTYSNEEWLGVGAPLEVFWPNNLNETEEFHLELWVLLPYGNGFEYRLVEQWAFMDGDGLEAGDDGVVDFVMGTCQYQGADYEFPMWMNLPDEEITITVGTQSGPGIMGTYFDISLSGVGEGFDISNQTYGVWCGDHDELIYLGQTYQVTAQSSLANVLPEDFTLTREQLDKINFFYNSLPELIPGYEYNNPSAYWEDIQNTFWALAGDEYTSNDNIENYLNYVNQYAEGYKVPPGGYAAILFWNSPNVQIIFTVVDPCVIE